MKLYFVFIAIAFSGCASLPTAEDASRADHGTYPVEYELIVKRYYERSLKDPESARYKGISVPKPYWLGNRLSGSEYGYLVCATLNAKNSYGAYVGYQTDGFLIKNGDIVKVVPKGNWFGKQIC